MTFSSLLAAETELSVCHNGMTELQQKFHESEENNRKLSQLVEDHREQIRDLTLETKRLGMENIQQTKTIEEKFKKNFLLIEQWMKDMNGKIAQQGTKIEEVHRKNLQLEREIKEKNSRHQKTSNPFQRLSDVRETAAAIALHRYNKHLDDRIITNSANPMIGSQNTAGLQFRTESLSDTTDS